MMAVILKLDRSRLLLKTLRNLNNRGLLFKYTLLTDDTIAKVNIFDLNHPI